MSQYIELQNLWTLYKYAAGLSEVPEQFHKWSLVSAVAAVCQNKVWFCKEKPGKLYPNLYTMLIGPSGCGKGTAIGRAVHLLEPMAEEIGLYQGRLTASFIADWFTNKDGRGKSQHDDGATSRLFLVTPELQQGIGKNDAANDIVVRMTDLFTGELLSFNDGTVTSGLRKAGKPVVNWMAGTTKEWLAGLRADSMKGGFFARTLLVQADYDNDRRLVRPIYPENHDYLWKVIQSRFAEIADCRGEFRISDEAAKLEETWYKHRPPAKHPDMVPSWKRVHDLILKVSMTYSLLDNTKLIIESSHLHSAIADVERVKQLEALVIDYLGGSKERDEVDFVESRIRMEGRISHADLMRKCSPRGILTRRLKEVIDTLNQARRIVVEDLHVEFSKTQTRWYKWVGDETLTDLDVLMQSALNEEQESMEPFVTFE